MNAWDLLWYAITQLGSDYFYVAALTVVYLALDRKLGSRLAIVTLSNIWLAAFLKDFFKIPRPPKELWKYQVEGYAFPSGHAQGTTVFWGYLSLYYQYLPLFISSAIIIVLVCYSRIELGVHSVFDVVGGVFFGLLILLTSFIVERKVSKKLGNYNYPSLIFLTIFLFLISLISGYGGKDAAVTTGALLGMSIGFYVSRNKVKRNPNIFEGLLNVAFGAPFAFFMYKLTSVTQLLILQFLMMAIMGFVIAILPMLTEKFTAKTKGKNA